MKCPACGFISFDDIAQCKKCGAQLKAVSATSGATTRPAATPEPSSLLSKPVAATAPPLPPQWAETISFIKKELEEIEGGPVDMKTHLQSSVPSDEKKQPAKIADSAEPSPLLLLDVHTMPKGGFFLRMLAYVIDCTILNFISIILIAAGYVSLSSVSSNFDQTDTLAILRALLIPYYFLDMFYFTYCHAVTGQTIGKWVCGLKVVRSSGEVLGFRRAVLRWLGYLVSRFFIYLGFLWIAFSREKRGWHDIIAGSYVIKI